jgi:2-succinyl-5-enolpyruvyl-6-hydroxy-3-cyclohexene-1-carboxylate synthase
MSAAVQTVWADLVARTLCDAGVTTAVVSPGSRSTPLVYALAAAGQLAMPTLVDERTAGFFALGIARATGEPVALVCTSGTAAAHYLPAIIEASESGIPLVVITADRPPELQGCAAPQTIDQVKLYGTFVRGYLDLGAPDGSALALRAVRRKVAQAVGMARGPAAGPVHLEVPLRKPLEPQAPSTDAERQTAAAARAILAAPLVMAPPPVLHADDAVLDALALRIAASPRTVIVVGPIPAPHADIVREALHALAARAGAPLLAEAGSQARLAPRPADVVACDHFDLVLADAQTRGVLAPDLVIQIGAEPVAMGWPVIRDAWREADRWVVPGATWLDPDSSAAGIVRGELADTLERLATRLPSPLTEAGWLAAWAAADELAGDAVDAGDALDVVPVRESAAIRAVVAALPAGTTLVIGNSLPVRTVDEVCPGGGAPLAVITQRGANGIDGLVAGAAGAAFAGQPTVLLIGDVSFAHDVGSLAAARLARAPLAIVVVDNGGGRIFDRLPIGSETPAGVLERHWTTPPGVDPVLAAAAYGITAQAVRSPDELASAVAGALAGAGPLILHAPVASDGQAAFRRTTLDHLARLRADRAAAGRSPVREGARR